MAVTGIGGFFFRSSDPESLTEWYEKHLGINGFDWAQQAGQTVFAPFPNDTDYFGSTSQAFMLNLRVDDLEGMLRQFTKDGVRIVKAMEHQDDVGHFAWIEDPERNRVELWEPTPSNEP